MPTQGHEHSFLGDDLERLHLELRRELPAVDRLAIATYDSEGGKLRTFVHSTRGAAPISLYEIPLAEVRSLEVLAQERRDRVIDDLTNWPASESQHVRWLASTGYRSSFTRPLFEGGELQGFLFCDATELAYFTPRVLERLEVHVKLASMLLQRALAPVKALRGAVRLSLQLGHLRDEETGAHLQRMSRYSRLIGSSLATRHGLSDEQVEFLFLFAPMHDIGKVGIPDRVLLKPGSLDADELSVMHAHVRKGAEVVDTLLHEFGGAVPHEDMLRNIVLYHHEASDGSGYMAGLRGDAIPLEARIVAVADVYDALTSERPYKPAWSQEDAFSFLCCSSPGRFDAECVAALANAAAEAEEIRLRFQDAPLGTVH
jgi:HD-GYP domain-containing protein (c-di-GMP phosphodiesterase class II)